MTNGTNKLTLNEAQLREAVQYWLDNKIWNPAEVHPVVCGVEATAYGGDYTFTLKAPAVADA